MVGTTSSTHFHRDQLRFLTLLDLRIKRHTRTTGTTTRIRLRLPHWFKTNLTTINWTDPPSTSYALPIPFVQILACIALLDGHSDGSRFLLSTARMLLCASALKYPPSIMVFRITLCLKYAQSSFLFVFPFLLFATHLSAASGHATVLPRILSSVVSVPHVILLHQLLHYAGIIMSLKKK